MNSTSSLRIVDPLRSSLWRDLVTRHHRAGIFHSPEWLTALHQTFRCTPWAVVGPDPGSPSEPGWALVVCTVDSPLTGNRFVSLPFSDHCEPLADEPGQLQELLREPRFRESRPVQFRPLGPGWGPTFEAEGMTPSVRFLYHEIDLRPGAATVFQRFHRDCIRRKIRRAERDGLTVERGNRQTLLDDFYRLHLQTRRRQGTPAQPWSWFLNLGRLLGDRLTVYVAYQESCPAAAIVTLRWADCLTYKYGASDERRNASGGTPLLFWEAIQDACALGLERFDLGRSDPWNTGLAQFKERLGGRSSQLIYYQRPPGGEQNRLLKHAAPWLRRLPMPLFRLLGNLLYRHFG